MLKKYKIVGLSTEGKIRFRGKDYDLNKLDDATAEFLYNNKAGCIEKVDKVDKVEPVKNNKDKAE